MLHTDQVTINQVVEKVEVDKLFNRPGWVKTYKDLSWFEEVTRRKVLNQRRYKKYRKKKIVKKYSEYY